MLEAALAALCAKLGDADVARDVERVDLRGAAALTLELDRPPARRWFGWNAVGLVELDPEQDAELPLARHAQALGADVVAWRPGRRIVLRQRHAHEPVFWKGYRKRRSADAGRAHAAACRAATGVLHVPRLLERREDLECLVFGNLPGRAPRLESDEDTFFRQLGSALAAFQQADVSQVERVHSATDELAVLDTLAERARKLLGALPEEWSELRAELGSTPDMDEAADLVLAHRDLHDGQLVVGGCQPGLLDFDLLCRADGALDPANLAAHLELRAMQRMRGADGSTTTLDHLAFLSGYGKPSAPLFPERLRFYRSATLLRLALVYAMRPRWSWLTPGLVRRARLGLRKVDPAR